jgi:hypothetical protein
MDPCRPQLHDKFLSKGEKNSVGKLNTSKILDRNFEIMNYVQMRNDEIDPRRDREREK